MSWWRKILKYPLHVSRTQFRLNESGKFSRMELNSRPTTNGDVDQNQNFKKKIIAGQHVPLSPGQTDRQVVASGRKFNLRRDLRLVARRTRKFYRKYTQIT